MNSLQLVVALAFVALASACEDAPPPTRPPGPLSAQACRELGGEVIAADFTTGKPAACEVSLGIVDGVRCMCECCLKMK